MQPLKCMVDRYMNITSIDGHMHVCSHRGLISKHLQDLMPPIRIGFADIELDHIPTTTQLSSIYKEATTLTDTYLLATGMDIEQVKTIYKELVSSGSGCYGFGELKLYDEFNGNPVKYKKISFAHEVCKFSESVGCLPVYIHYELNNIKEAGKLERLLEEHPEVPIVLCHCGMNEDNREFAWGQCIRLGNIYTNLWFDLSWDASKWLSKNPLLVTQLPPDRVFWGSDVSPRLEAHGFISAKPDDIIYQNDLITPYIASDTNLRRLFKI